MADKVSLRSLYQFYRPLVVSASGEIANLKSNWKRVVAMIVTTILFLFNRNVAPYMSAVYKWHGFSRWWAVFPAALLFIYYLAKANYKKFQEQAAAGTVRESDLTTKLLAERDRTQQPDVALVWDWSEDQKRIRASDIEKIILIENRSNQYIYNVQIEPVKLTQQLTFDLINEIAPRKQHAALGRWNGMSSAHNNYVYFFGNNEQAALDNGWIFKKVHPTGAQ